MSTLSDIIKKSIGQNREIVIVEDTPEKITGEYKKTLLENSENLTDLLEKPVSLQVMPKKDSLNLTGQTIIMYDKQGVLGPENFESTKEIGFHLSRKNDVYIALGLLSEASKSGRGYYSSLFSGTPLEGKFLCSLEGGKIQDNFFPMIKGIAAKIRHSYGAEKDREFMNELSDRFAQGNLQSCQDKKFLVVSDRITNKQGKFDVIKLDEEFQNINFGEYMAVFIDNNYKSKEGKPSSSKIGTGIQALKKISSLNPGIPLFYQTAHKTSAFTPEETRTISENKGILLQKNTAPKISLSRKVAEKEVETGRIISNNPELQKYCTVSIPINQEGYLKVKDKFITFTKAASKKIIDEEKKNHFLKTLGIKPSQATNKLYTIALFHEEMKNELQNPKLQLVGKEFFDFNKIYSSIINTLPEETEELPLVKEAYESAVNQYQSKPSTTIIHNDAKWDNWFHNKILGDFGSVTPGRESKDIARIMIDEENLSKGVIQEKYFGNMVKAYSLIRESISGKAYDENELRNETVGMLITEPLRIAFYKAANNDKETTSSLLKIAKESAKNYSTMIPNILVDAR